jgi:hypothetical protein
MAYEPEGWKRLGFSSKVGWLVLLMPASLLAVFILVAIFMSATASGRADFCYVTSAQPKGMVWEVEAHRSWRPDLSLGLFPSYEAAKRAGEAFGCRFYTEQVR